MSFKINIDVKPDSQAQKSGLTLNSLLRFLQLYENLEWLSEDKDGDNANNKEIKAWRKYFRDVLNLKNDTIGPAQEVKEDKIYFTVPIEINLAEGEYGINHLVILYTKADLSIVGVEDKTVIKLYRFDFQSEENYLYKSYWNQLFCFKASKKWVVQQDPDTGNTLTLRNLKFRLEEGLWFPLKYVSNYDHSNQELQLGIIIYYSYFPNAILSKIDIEAKDNGQFVLVQSEECACQKITDCRLYLNNWFDHTVGDWEKRREMGANLNMFGANKSALVARNTFIKHGNDEALTFFTIHDENSNKIETSVHENIEVVDNTFTYLDANVDIVGPVKPVEPDANTRSAGDSSTGISTRPVHLNGVLITFNPFEGVKSIWKNLLFARNTVNLQGPVGTAVSMTVIPGDLCQNVEFSNNRLNHTYKYNGLRPGNATSDGITSFGAPDTYLYSSSFTFQRRKDTSGMHLTPDTDTEDTGTDTMPVPAATTEEIIPTPVVFRNNEIHYSQLMRDHDFGNNYILAAEHACFTVGGGDVEILDNTIDGSNAQVKRLPGSDGVFGNADNPVSLLHCLPCTVPGTNSVVMRGNRAEGYGVALRFRPQYDLDFIVSDYYIQVEANEFLDGAATVLHNMNDSNIYIVRNVFHNCQKVPFVTLNTAEADKTEVRLPAHPAVTLSLFQNLLTTANNIKDYKGVCLDANWHSTPQVINPLSRFCFLLNYLDGYDYMTVTANAATKTNITDNIYAPGKTDDGCAC